ncbi:MAG TPA: hypothetical protein VM914_02385 [Pyrinomonadaceae bacterium]|nr:hypothetical protein [Pyrinomonadaceae bacterium]
MGKVALILGIIGMVIGGGVFLVSVLLPPLTNGRTSWEEAMFGIIPGALLLMGSSVVAIVGVVLLIMKKKKAAAGVRV